MGKATRLLEEPIVCDTAAIIKMQQGVAGYRGKDGNNQSVPELFCEYTRPLKCNRKTAEDPCLNQENYFPYHRFRQYLRVQSDLERIGRLEAILAGQEVPSLPDFSDIILKWEFSRMYGGVDQDNSSFEKLFQNYKVGRLEELTEWLQDEEHLRRRIYEGVNDIVKFEKPDLAAEFSPQELALFESVATGPSCGKEWFVVPRKTLSAEDVKEMRPKSINLALFDPELSHYGGPRVVPPQASNRDDRGVSEKLAVNISEIISRFPGGITAKEFLTEYKRMFGYTPDYLGLGYDSFFEFLVDLDHVAFTQRNGPNNDFMMYPTYTENFICAPMDTLWRIYHKLIVILKFFDGIAKTDQLVNCFQQFYRIQLPYFSWGFSNMDEFVVYLVENVKWRSDHYVVEKTSVVGSPNKKSEHYIRALPLDSRSSPNELKMGNSNNKTSQYESIRRHEGPAIPNEFVSLGCKIPYYASDISINENNSEYVVVYFCSPTDFELSGVNSWTTLSHYTQQWNNVYRSLHDSNGQSSASADPKAMQAGLLLVIFNEETTDYVRAQYVRSTDKHRMHRVRLIDEGGCITVHEENMYYMLKSVLDDLEPLVIRAGLWNVQSPRYGTWSNKVLDFAYGIMCPEGRNQQFYAKFVSFEKSERKWLVNLKMNNRKKDLSDVGDIINNYQQSLGQKVSYKWDGASEMTDKKKPHFKKANVNGMHRKGNQPVYIYNKKQNEGSAESNWRSSPNNTVSGNNINAFRVQNKFSYQPQQRVYNGDTLNNNTSWRNKNGGPGRYGEQNSFPCLAESGGGMKRFGRKRPNFTSRTFYANVASNEGRKY